MGFTTIIVALLFTFSAHQGLRETDRLEQPLLAKSERAGNYEQVGSIKLVFDTEQAKLREERRAWLWAIAGGGVATIAGLTVTWLALHTRSYNPRRGSAP